MKKITTKLVLTLITSLIMASFCTITHADNTVITTNEKGDTTITEWKTTQTYGGEGTTTTITPTSTYSDTTTKSASSENQYVPAIIPKADTLPGPNENNQRKSAFSDKVLPILAVMLVGAVAGVSLLFLIIGGVRFATAYGNEESLENAKKQVIYAIVGLLLAIFSYTIVRIVTNVRLEGDTTENINETQAETAKGAAQGITDGLIK